MENRTLQVILEHCFPPARLKRILSNKPANRDWYEAAADEILNETEIGAELTDALDSDSKPQQAKIRAMKVAELRDNLTVEFLEPGKTLGLILWALLSDERLSARNLADKLAESFGEIEEESYEIPSEEDEEEIEFEIDGLEEDQEEDEVFVIDDIDEEETVDVDSIDFDDGVDESDIAQPQTLDQKIAELDEAREENSSEEVETDDLDLDALLDEIRSEDDIVEEEEIEDGLDFLDEEEPVEEIEAVGAEEKPPVEPVEINDDLLEEVDSFIASLDEDEPDALEEDETLEELEELDAQSFVEDIEIEDSETAVEDESEDEDYLDEEIEIELPEEDFDFGDLDDEAVEIVAEEERTESLPVPTVQLGGISISVTSLKRACESVFSEPVELVTDESLTSQDQIVVVGRQCGVRILHGPTWTQPIEPFRESTGETVTINPQSLRLALSRIYSEPIELIPDPKLLNAGMILFAGKNTGLAIMENLRANVPLPDWSEGLVEDRKEPSTDLEDEIADLRERIQAMQSRLETLESAPPAPAPQAPVVEEEAVVEEEMIEEPVEIEPPAEEPPVEEIVEENIAEDEIVEESGAVEGHIADSPISLEEIESEELEPVVDADLEIDEGLNDDVDLDAVISGIGEDELSDEGLDIGEVDLEELDLEGLGEEESDDGAEESIGEIAEEPIDLEDEPEEITDLSEIDLEELDDSSGGESEEIAGLDEIDLDDLESGDEEISLDGDDLSEAGGEEPSLDDADLSEPEGEELSLDDIGLEDLGELGEIGDEGEEEAESGDVGEDELNLEDLNLDAFEDYSSGDEGGESEAAGLEEEAEEEPALEDVDLGDILNELDSDDDDAAPEAVFQGETILLLGGEAKNKKEYKRVIEEIGGKCAWHANLNETPEGEIAALVESADMVMTLSAEAISDPGILQAVNYAEEQEKPVVQHHSSSPVSVQKQLVKLMQEE